MMELWEFVLLVRDLRELQKDYVLDPTQRTRSNLKQMKALERRVDSFILAFVNERVPQQSRLIPK